ncbi:MAG: rod shape-determining protein RodA [Actinobacteria bacterium]|nr:rod shape-determining protein RodA [Actinomycetota bacterium]
MSTTTIIRKPDAAKSESAVGFQLPFDLVLVLATAGLAICSVLTIAAATATDVPGSPDYFVVRQLVYFGVGGLLAVALWRTDYSRLRELKYFFYGALILSILTVIAFGSVARGSRRAIDLPLFSFQASELGKVLLVVSLSAFTIDMTRRAADSRTTARLVAIGLAPAALVMLQPDLGSALVFVAITATILFIAGVPWQHFAAAGAVAVAAVVLALAVLPSAGINVLHSYQKDRLTAFLHPSETSGREGYQQNQSRIAIGSGEKTGRGASATQTKYNFLPEHHTDFIFAVVGERWGFAGAALVLSLYALMIWRALRILTMAKNLYGALLAGGIVAMLMFQVFVNVGMTVGIMPITGIPLPLMSYGGSSLIATMLAVGLLQSIYAQGRNAAMSQGRVLTFQ